MVREFISAEDFQAVLALLGLPGDTLRIEIGNRDEPMAGVNSAWMMKATVASFDPDNPHPHRVTVYYVPVMLPSSGRRQYDETGDETGDQA